VELPRSIAELSPRLRAVAGRVIPGEAVADLCCDHAYLAIALVAGAAVPRAVAADLNAGPLAAAAAHVAAAGLQARVELRRGDGAEVLEAGEVASVVIAGVGARLAARIVAAGEASGRLADVRRLVIQANHGFPQLGELRVELARLGWDIVDEGLAREGRRFYVVLALERGAGAGLADAVDRELGPILRRGADPLFADWLADERERTRRALAGMDRARAEGPERAAIRERYAAWLELLCVQRGARA
jgi:tRNA (adenine22-N1)-methyltransferase